MTNMMEEHSNPELQLNFMDPEEQPLCGQFDSAENLVDCKAEPSKKETGLLKCIGILIVHSIPSIASYQTFYLAMTMNIHYISASGQLSSIGGTGLGQTWINTIYLYVIS